MEITLIEDVNQKQSQHILKNEQWAEHGVRVIRNKLPYGDYTLAPAKVVDTKRDILELAGNLTNDHRRFRDAAIKAMECGTYMIILVENTDGVKTLDDLAEWVEPERSFRTRQRKNINAQRWRGRDIHIAKDGHEYDRGIAHICREMSKKYGLEFDFCTPEESWNRVMRHLGVVV